MGNADSKMLDQVAKTLCASLAGFFSFGSHLHSGSVPHHLQVLNLKMTAKVRSGCAEFGTQKRARQTVGL